MALSAWELLFWSASIWVLLKFPWASGFGNWGTPFERMHLAKASAWAWVTPGAKVVIVPVEDAPPLAAAWPPSPAPRANPSLTHVIHVLLLLRARKNAWQRSQRPQGLGRG